MRTRVYKRDEKEEGGGDMPKTRESFCYLIPQHSICLILFMGKIHSNHNKLLTRDYFFKVSKSKHSLETGVDACKLFSRGHTHARARIYHNKSHGFSL